MPEIVVKEAYSHFNLVGSLYRTSVAPEKENITEVC